MIERFNRQNFRNLLTKYAMYRKCYGLLTASMCDLPIVSEGFIISGSVDEKDIQEMVVDYGDIVMCRPDAKYNSWHRLLRGKDVCTKDILNYYNENRKHVSEMVLLCFKHPSIYFTGNKVERWGISGGINILFLWYSKIIVDYVGKGFDVGDISRGQTQPHQTITIDWSMVRKDLQSVWDTLSYSIISQDAYSESRKNRIEFLKTQGYNFQILENSIPLSFEPMEYKCFQLLYKECIMPVVWKKNLFNEQIPITILVNRYQFKFHVFEIWESSK